jgi:hypothetical protein
LAPRPATDASYRRETPALNLYLDHKAKWHLAYIVEDVRSRKQSKAARIKGVPMVYDYVIDAERCPGGGIAAHPDDCSRHRRWAG